MMSKQEIATMFNDAAALVEDNWTQGAWARNSKGKKCRPTSDDAVAWCAVGALAKVSGSDTPPWYVVNYLSDFNVNRPIPTWNDDPLTTAEDVAATFRNAARKALGH